MKVCKVCGESDYSKLKKNKKSKDGVAGICNKCSYARYSEDTLKEEKHRAQWLKDNPGYGKQYRLDNKERIQERDRQYYQDNKDHYKEYFRIHGRTDGYRLAQERYHQSERGKLIDSIRSSRRRAHKRDQTPELTEQEKAKIMLYYTISNYLGKDWHVDHIYPIDKGGLHHPDNLQIVTKEYNLQKSNNEYFRSPTPLEYFRI